MGVGFDSPADHLGGYTMKFSDKLLALLTSRRFWVTVGASAQLIFTDVIGLDQQTSMGVTAALIAWVLGDSISKTGSG